MEVRTARQVVSSLISTLETHHLQTAFDSLESTGSPSRDAVVAAELEPVKQFCICVANSNPEVGYSLGAVGGYSDSFFRNVAESCLSNLALRELYDRKHNSPTAATTIAKRVLGTLGANSVHIRLHSLTTLFETLHNMLNHSMHIQQPSLFDLAHLSPSSLLTTDIRAIGVLDPVLSFLCDFVNSILNEWFKVNSQRQQALNGCVYEYLSSLDEVTIDSVLRMRDTLRSAECSPSVPVVVTGFKSLFVKPPSQVVRIPSTVDKLGLAGDFIATKMQLSPCNRGVIEEIVRQLKQYYNARAAQQNAEDELLESQVLQGTCFAATVWLTACLGEMVVVGEGVWENDEAADGGGGYYLPEPANNDTLEELRWTAVYAHVSRHIDEDLKPLLEAATVNVRQGKSDFRADVCVVKHLVQRLEWFLSAMRSGEENALCDFEIPLSAENTRRLGYSERVFYIGSDLYSARESRQQGEWSTDTEGRRFTTCPQALSLLDQAERKVHVARHASSMRKVGEMLARIAKHRDCVQLVLQPIAFIDTQGNLRRVAAALCWRESDAVGCEELYQGLLYPIQLLANCRSQPRGSRWRASYDVWRAWRGIRRKRGGSGQSGETVQPTGDTTGPCNPKRKRPLKARRAYVQPEPASSTTSHEAEEEGNEAEEEEEVEEVEEGAEGAEEGRYSNGVA